MDIQPTLNLREDFLLNPEITYLNHGSFGATPRPVFERYQAWQHELEYQPTEFLGRRAGGLLAESRACLSDYLGTTRDNLVYVTNATTGLNIVARSLKLSPYDEVLATDHEYGALDRTWRFLSQKQGFKYINHPIHIPVSTVDNFVEDLWQGVTPNTRVIFLSHITSPTALIFPVHEVCRRARQEGILTVVDGAHAPGQVPLALDEIGADFYSGNLHKWLCAPKGAAFLYTRPEHQALIEPLIVSWGWQADVPSAVPLIDYVEYAGTRDISAFLAVPDAIAYQREHHWDNVRETCHQLTCQALERIQQMTGLEPLSPVSPAWFGQMVSAVLPAGTDTAQLHDCLYHQYRVEVPVLQWKDYGLVRCSFQGYNHPEDVETLVQALQKLLFDR